MMPSKHTKSARKTRSEESSKESSTTLGSTPAPVPIPIPTQTVREPLKHVNEAAEIASFPSAPSPRQNMDSVMMPKTERRIRSESRMLPKSLESLVNLFKQVVELPNLHSIEVTGTAFTVQRIVGDGEEVIPTVDADDSVLDPAFILSTLQARDRLVELDFDPQRHPYHALLLATHTISALHLRPTFLVVAEGPWLQAFLGLSSDEALDTCLGMKVIYTRSETFEDKILILGGATNLLTDATYGVAIDMGA